MSFPDDVRARMLELEKLGDGVNMDEAAARIAGIEFGPEFEESLRAEINRTLMLAADHYGVRVAVLPHDRATAVAFIQGLTFAKAIEELLHERSSSGGVPG